jgi:hypothetical protein
MYSRVCGGCRRFDVHALCHETLALFSILMPSWLTVINGIAVQDNAASPLCSAVRHAGVLEYPRICPRTPLALVENHRHC